MPTKTQTNNKTSLFYNLGSALFAFIAWGGWAYYVNHSLVSALTQGTASFIITLFLVKAVTQLYNKLAGKTAALLQLLLPAMITVSFTGSCLFLVHSLAGTAYITKTIAPALTVALIFCIVTAYKLKQGEKNA
jgi:hypothetical protein